MFCLIGIYLKEIRIHLILLWKVVVTTIIMLQWKKIQIMDLVIMYFLILRPQQKRAKAHADMIKAVRRGDTVVTSGGFIGRVTKVIDDHEIEIELAPETRVRLLRAMIAEVRTKGEPA